MLVARLGLRSIEAARPQLDDLDWRAGRVVLRGEASREDAMPLPANVGEALSAHLRQARPATGEPPAVTAAVLVSVAVVSNPAASDTQVSTWPERTTSTRSVCGNRWYGRDPPTRAKLWAIIRGGVRFWLTASWIRARRNALRGT
jgi:integrase